MVDLLLCPVSTFRAPLWPLLQRASELRGASPMSSSWTRRQRLRWLLPTLREIELAAVQRRAAPVRAPFVPPADGLLFDTFRILYAIFSSTSSEINFTVENCSADRQQRCALHGVLEGRCFLIGPGRSRTLEWRRNEGGGDEGSPRTAFTFVSSIPCHRAVGKGARNAGRPLISRATRPCATNDNMIRLPHLDSWPLCSPTRASSLEPL
ncbi:hypothetical protein HPB50_016647 [Hyalomma asiaticum]|uniref:Uncharacterized protein n=1 Tax=Hyalomma asiaticum TaxID=266040 RepID=A0ACB7TLN2_HYAAI|nr:hypothetical protein HPB50_016647 [Hyalomma asiaticum]